ncbi:PEP-CTERM sorting domain-containing protein [Opitutaceae bacterium TAV4]|nr:PEP-CTERM sorting domain-containing protein [Opitutaceae bacterium TAV4]RRK01544.1 PEP-CTERM sorting domain-containing protein [Opitutaceae bacterium TAV3]
MNSGHISSMRRISYHTMHAVASLATLTCALIVAPTIRASTANEAIVNYASAIQGYNLVTFGNTSMGGNSKTDSAVAVGGNFTLGSGSEIARKDALYPQSSSALTLYVGGQLALQGESKLRNGYASTPGMAGSWTDVSPNSNQIKFMAGGQILNLENSKDPNRSLNPGTNGASPNWAWNDLQSTFAAASKTLAAVTATASIIVTDQTLSVSVPSGVTGVVTVTLDANLFVGNQYNGQTVSSVRIDVPDDVNLVINVTNAAGRTVIAASGVNVHEGTNNDHLLWNILPGSLTDTSTTVQSATLLGSNSSQFYGSILAPLVDLNVGNATKIYGQIVANSYTQGQGGELYYNGAFTAAPSVAFSPVPEPQTWGMMMVGAGAFVLGLKSWRDRKRKQAAACPVALPQQV